MGLPGFIAFGRDICGELAQAERREWWLSNGIGGYAAGTIAGSLTRRYHGLLIAPLNPPLGRTLVVAKADATLIDGERRIPLFTNRWQGGAVDPQGFVHIESFRLDGRMPVWRYAMGGIRLEMRVWMEHGSNTSYVGYRLDPDPMRSQEELSLMLRVLVNARDHHVQTQPGDFSAVSSVEEGGLCVNVPGRLTLQVKADGGSINSVSYWVENIDLPAERERGLPDVDSHLCVGEAYLDLNPGKWVGLSFSLEEKAMSGLGEAMARSLDRDAGILRLSEDRAPEMSGAHDWIKQLVLAADSFVFARPLPDVPGGESVIAGYPWFGDWGRDTMIALPGLTLACGRYDTARRILTTFARYVDKGMLPNVFPEGGQSPEYNTVDASLWYIEAWRAYVEETGDLESLRQAFPVLQDIIEWYKRGTRYNIHMDPGDCLIYAGEPGVQVTWMDAKVGDWVVTPRIGKPVEVNALWYNANRVMAGFAGMLGVESEGYKDLADSIGNSFEKFIDERTGGLFDVVDGPGGNDGAVRPNQIFAVSLQHSPLDEETRKRVTALCKTSLLCSNGLRSLAPGHPDYRPHYTGGVWERDGSYHQGPVWAWLLGHYAVAEYNVHKDAAGAQSLLEPIRSHLMDAGLGSISEIFDGSPPHTPRGCPAQAWSVACVLDAWLRLERKRI